MRPEDLLARLEAGYEYDPMYGRLCNERDQLKVENAELREETEAAKHDLQVFSMCSVQLDAENAKLRELNESMWLIIRCATSHTSAEDGLPVIHEDDLAMLRSMRRDLGIEVDG